ncbi:MAG: Eco57I restriction-modification methylase domain-containing protein [Bacteroidetes bacterium]|nr:Eco57I restriction-modification methylase domain-containing protein [Bacteroidota bacterium]
MKLVTQTPKKALKAFLKQKPLRSEIDVFKTNLIALLDKISVIEKRPKDETEEHLKNDLRDFLRDTYYRDTNAINTKDKKDLVIHLDKTTNSEVGVIIEAKRPTNIGEMVTADNPNKKALHELILYYLDERNKVGNFQLKQLVITNINEWYIIDANHFDKHIYNNTQIQTLYKTKVSDNKNNPFFYQEIEKLISKIDVEIPCVYFDIREYDTILRNNKKEDDRELSALLKILSPQHLLKIVTPNDSNSLNDKFYKELLHIIGLEEAKEDGKNIIRRKKESRFAASLIEATIEALQTEDVLHRLPDQSIYGSTKDKRIFNIALELCITWINRILFLKLLEGQLITYHQGNKEYRFLNTETINDFDELFKLFHKVLAINLSERSEAIKTKYRKVPYLNSSLFEISELEDQTIKINSLDNAGKLELIGTTILKEIKKKAATLPTLDYLFQFLDAYDFASEGTEDVQEDNKTIINASVLGKVFEQINGYIDGSIFTPAFITMYMCEQSIRLAVVEKFNEALSEKDKTLFDKFEDVKNYTSRLFKTQEILRANEIINSLRICDPAVGSGHFLVSSLNEIISIKAELGILADKEGNSISGYEIEIVNDELIITDPKTNILEYKLQNGKPLNKEIQRLQKALFHEKQTIIENCLFGVDINPNSVKICRLRLWIELLKNAYYKEETNFLELETLPNIDINIKCGNSLLSRFPLDADLSKALKSIKYDVKAYRGFVNDYKNEKSRDVKRGLQKIIDTIKTDFRTEIGNNDPKQIKLKKLSGDLFTLLNQGQIFELTPKENKARKEKQTKLEADITKLSKEIEEIKSNAIYKNAFEWRFEFPEVLSNDGEFEGFDVIIANPPYIQHRELAHLSANFKENYNVYSGTSDISSYFFEKFTKIIKPKGIISVINSNKFFNAEYGRPLRKYLSNYPFISIINFEQVPIFDEALVSSAIFTITNNSNKEAFDYVKYFKEKVDTLEDIEEINKRSVSIDQSILKNDNWLFNDANSNIIVNKIKSKGIPIADISDIDIKRGLTTGYDDAFLIDKEKYELLSKGSKNPDVIIKKVLKGENINRYKINFKDLWIINSHNGIKGLTESINVERDFPLIFQHLQSVNLQSNGKVENRSDKGKHWTNLRSCAFINDFSKPKIVWGLISGNWDFAFDNVGYFLTSASFFLTSNSIEIKFILALLNSKLYRYYFIQVGEYTAGGAFVLKKISIEKFIIPTVNEKEHKPFIALVDKILTAKQQGKNSLDLENQIDDLVYKLFDITTEEQKIIEGR